MAIFTPLRCSVRDLDARRHRLQIEQCPPATRARHIIGLERAATRRLQNVVSQPQRLPAAGLATNQNRVANPIRQQRTDDHRGAQQGDLWLKRCSVGAVRRGIEPQARHYSRIQTILQQNGIVPAKAFQLRSQQTECTDGGQLHAVLHCHQLSLAVDFKILGGINFRDVQVFVNRLRFHVILGSDLGRDLVPRGAGDDDTDELFAAAFHAVASSISGVSRRSKWNGSKGKVFGVPALAGSVRRPAPGGTGHRTGQFRHLRQQIAADLDFTRRILRE